MTAMSTVPWLTILGLIPLVGALVVAFAPGTAESAKRMAIGFSVVTLVVGIIAAIKESGINKLGMVTEPAPVAAASRPGDRRR